MAAYQHSEAFASLKNIKEGIQENLTTYQYLEVLDFFIESALDPLASAVPDFLDNFYSVVVAWQAHKPSVKFSRDDKQLLPVKLFNSLTTQGKTKRLHQKSMLLNRGLLFGALSTFFKLTASYKKLQDPTQRYTASRRAQLIQKVERLLNVKTNLYSAFMQSEWYATKAYKFKSLISQKYTRMALMNAKRTYTELNCEVPLDDIVQVYLVFLNRAIDRCDSRQGVLTSFIQVWFYSARAEVQKSVPTHASYDEFMSQLPIKHIDAGSHFEALQHLSHLAKGVDRQGVVRYTLGIPEFFTAKQRQTLSTFAKQ